MKFTVKANLVVLSFNLKDNKKYILSLDEKKIVLPSLTLDKTMSIGINQTLITYLKSLMAYKINDLSFIPQIISLDSIYVQDTEDVLNSVFGFLVDYNTNTSNCYWIEFDYGIPNHYSNLIFEVVQKLQ